jgi:hypothetical protein
VICDKITIIDSESGIYFLAIKVKNKNKRITTLLPCPGYKAIFNIFKI